MTAAGADRLFDAEWFPTLSRFFFCIGAQKAGTTWLDGMLRRHPDCHLPANKEVRYWDWRVDRPQRFAHQIAEERVAAARGHLRSALLKPWRLPWARRRLAAAETYRAMLRAAGTPEGEALYVRHVMGGYAGQGVAGDVSPGYSLLETPDFTRMARVHPNTRFVVLLRDPVARHWSAIKHRFRKGLGDGTVDDAEVLGAFRASLDEPSDINRRRGDYPRMLSALEAAVPASRIGVFFYERLFDERYFRRVTDFLGLAPMEVDAAFHPNRNRRPGLRPTEGDLRRARAVLAPAYDDAAARFGAEIPTKWRQPERMEA
ncbi:MAG: sulfotransferase [Pseudomonadota bacterium]